MEIKIKCKIFYAVSDSRPGVFFQQPKKDGSASMHRAVLILILKVL